MSHRLDTVKKITAADADVLSATALDPAPADGVMRIFAASTVNTATMAITPSLHASPTGPGTQAVILRANGEVRAYDPHWETEVSKGEKVTIAIAGTTGTVYIWTSFISYG